ncbi:ABC transporter substrate-binding protein [Rhizobium puerariae]|uniref:ABC transporter substrate-binding protein n=1 Tax=Rhizobium puerariae TaxID=1585791 RepID=A0ABV6ADJ6_9HYPH
MTRLSRRDFTKAFGLTILAGSVFDPAVLRAEEAQRGGTLRIAVQTEPVSLTDLQQNSATSGVGARVHEGLIHVDYELKPYPYLATEWTISEDGLTYAFKLRQGVKWHDGHPFTSADVAYSIRTLKEIHPRRRITFANITAIETPDDHTVILKLSQPAPYLLGALTSQGTPIIARHLYDGTDPTTNPHNVAPVGTGPYIFKEWVRGSHYLLERNPDYWDQPKPYLDAIVVRFIPDVSARTAALESGEVDLGGQTPISFFDIPRFKNNPKFKIDTRGAELTGNLNQVFFNLENPYLKDLRVRRAIAHAINLEQYIEVVWLGYAAPAPTAIVPGMVHFHDSSLKPYAFDPARSEALLDEAGFKRQADGTRFRLRILHNTINSRLLPAAEFFRSALAKIGIALDINSSDFATYVQRIYKERAFDLDVQTLVNGYDPTDGIQRAYWSKNIKEGLPWSNQTHYVNADVDRIFETAAVEPNQEKRRALYVELQQILYRDLPALNLAEVQQLLVHDAKVQNPINDATGNLGNFAETSIGRV